MNAVAILYKLLLTILLFSYNIVFTHIYKIGQIYAKNQDIKCHPGTYDVIHSSSNLDTFMKALVILNSILFAIFNFCNIVG